MTHARYKIHHQTIYTYNQPVFLEPHTIRLRPRSDGWQNLLNFSLSIEPTPTGISQVIDLDGNSILQVWFTQPTETLTLNTHAEVETYLNNPFYYLLEPWALTLPIDYPRSLFSQLQPYLHFYNQIQIPAACIIELAQDILHEVQGNPINFLSTLNQQIYQTCQYIVRETGDPWQPSITWKTKKGSCRDTAVLFMEVCRVVGLGARFVSGYQEGDRLQEQRDLHAWVEVYLPGGGWRGYDPTQGLAVANGYIALAASPQFPGSAPVTGKIIPMRSATQINQVAKSAIDVHISIEKFDTLS